MHWSDQTVLECAARCAADASCCGFSVEKAIGGAWAAGRDAVSGEVKSDGDIRVPAVNARSNAWIEGCGTILKKRD